MQPKVSMFVKILLNRFHPGVNEAFLKGLPEEEARAVMRQNVAASDPGPLLTLPQDIVARTHYSWIAPALKPLPAWKRQAIVSALPEPQFKGLAALLHLPTTRKRLSPAIQALLTGCLLEVWHPHKDNELMPLSFLPPSPLSPLLELSKVKLVELIDLLAMHDLSESIRHIVDKKQLTAIYSCLPEKKQQFLRMCLHQKEKVTAPKLEMEKWDGDPKKLELTLHKRGLLRFGKALSGQHPQFFWYIAHTLDTGRGAALARYYQEEAIPDVTPLLVQQILSLINFINQKEPS